VAGSPRRDRVQENPPSVTESALSRFRYDAIVSNKSFRIATARRNYMPLLISCSSFTRSVHLAAHEILRLRVFDAHRKAVDSGFFEEITNHAVWPVPASWYLREILRTRFFSRRLLHIARFRSSPAIARWGVVQLVGHLTVNEDGEGSNPSAPAKFVL
jgi:hypothetical protein